MKIVSDRGNLRNQINSVLGNLLSKCLPQKMLYILRYYSHRHKLPNFEHPKDLSERILASMLSPEFLNFAIFADKVRVQGYIKSKGLGELLIPQYGSWETAEEIPFDELPNKFILKANNGCGGHIICTDKTSLNITETIKRMNQALKASKNLKKTEPHYCKIQPLILCEELLGNGEVLPIDYKFLCIKGKVAAILAISDREDDARKMTLDSNWNVLPYVLPQYLPKRKPEKPEHLKEMVEVAEILSEDFEFVRVDLYDFEGKIYFGELTFSPAGGILHTFSTEALETLGALFSKE